MMRNKVVFALNLSIFFFASLEDFTVLSGAQSRWLINALYLNHTQSHTQSSIRRSKNIHGITIPPIFSADDGSLLRNKESPQFAEKLLRCRLFYVTLPLSFSSCSFPGLRGLIWPRRSSSTK